MIRKIKVKTLSVSLDLLFFFYTHNVYLILFDIQFGKVWPLKV